MEKKSKLAEIKTKPTTVSVTEFINAIPEEHKRQDAFALLDMMQKISDEAPILWGSAIIGFGNKRYKSPTSGREVDWFLIGFAPRKANFSLYLTTIISGHDASLEKLGKYKTGGGCLYINKLADVSVEILEGLIEKAFHRNQL